jgi:hypothetical protein
MGLLGILFRGGLTGDTELRLSCRSAGDVIHLLHEDSHRTIARATGGGY